VARAAFDALPPASRDRLLHHAVVLEDGDAAPPGVAAADAGALAAAPPDAAPPEAPALEVTEFREDRIAGQVAGGRPGLLFVSIPYDADWRAEVDGRPVRPWRVNIGFLGIAWPAGARELRLEFVPRTVLLGRAMTAAGFAAWGLLAVGRIRRRG
jgi:hypothetical protein